MGHPICGEAQGFREGVLEGVESAVGSSQESRSAVFLVHAESLRQAPSGSTGTAAAGRLSVEDRRLSHGECERLVTRGTAESNIGPAPPVRIEANQETTGSHNPLAQETFMR